MDGTLWDAVDSYCKVWNECFRAFGVERVVMRRELVECMGLPLDEIYRRIAGDSPVISPEAYLPRLEQLEKEMMPRLGGKPYPHMRECMEQLSEHYAVFLLSNCGVNGLTDMMRYTGITPFVTEAVTFGATQRPKSENMRMLCEKYGLKQAVYVSRPYMWATPKAIAGRRVLPDCRLSLPPTVSVHVLNLILRLIPLSICLIFLLN